MKLRASGSDTSTAYYFGIAQINTSTGAVTGSNLHNGASWQLTGIRNNAATRNTADVTLSNPQLAKVTSFSTTGAFDNGSTTLGFAGGGFQDSSTSFDGFTLSASSGNLSGVVYVYGMAV